MPKIHGFRNGRYNGRYYTNNLGHVIKANEEGIRTIMGFSATVISNLIMCGFIAIGAWLGYKLGRQDTEVTEDMLWENSVPAAELAYLKENSVYNVIDSLRWLRNNPNFGDPRVDEVVDKTIPMLQALNAVKMPGAGINEWDRS